MLRSLGTRKANLYSIDYQHDLFMPIKEPLDANSRKTMRETRNNLYTERGRPVKIHRFLIRVLELFLGNLDDFKKIFITYLIRKVLMSRNGFTLHSL